MSHRTNTLMKSQYNSYSFNRTLIPFPETNTERVKPPESKRGVVIDSSHIFKLIRENSQEFTMEDKIKIIKDDYYKAERIVVTNFYTGGGAYKKGVLDMIYRGVNPLKPK